MPIGDPVTRSLFPLRLEPFEIYMVRESTPEYPMNTEVRLDLRGDVATTAFQRALDAAFARQPLFNARVDWSDPGRPRWLAAQHRVELHVTEGVASRPARWGTAFDLTNEPGMRVWLQRGDHTSRVLIEHHHALSDAIGFHQICSDILGAYACFHGRKGAIAVEALLPAREHALLKERGAFSGARQPWRRLANAVRVARMSAAAAAAVSGSSRPRDPSPRVTARVDTAQLSPLRDQARRAGCTFNDRMLEALMVELAGWNETHGDAARGDIRILVPTSLRTARHRGMPSANCLGYGFVSAPHALAQQETLSTVVRQTRQIKRYGLGSAFVDLAAWRFAQLRRRGQLGPDLVRPQVKCWASAVLSYMGHVDRFLDSALERTARDRVCAGNLELDGLYVFPPVRPLTRVALGVLYDGTQTTFAMRGDPNCLTSADLRELLDAFLSRLGIAKRTTQRDVEAA